MELAELAAVALALEATGAEIADEDGVDDEARVEAAGNPRRRNGSQ